MPHPRSDKDETEIPEVPWWEAQVCPVTRRPVDENWYCEICGGYHRVRQDRACAVCGGPVRDDGFCLVCLDKGGGVGYERLKGVVASCHGADCFGEVPGPHTHVWKVYECIGVSGWLSREETAKRCRELIETVLRPGGAVKMDERWAERISVLRSMLDWRHLVGLGAKRNLARQSGFLESELDAAIQEARPAGH